MGFVQGEPPPVEAVAMQHVARAIRDARGADEGVRPFARRLGIDPTTLLRLLAGEIYVDVVTLARMEQNLEATLWPGYLGLPQAGGQDVQS